MWPGEEDRLKSDRLSILKSLKNKARSTYEIALAENKSRSEKMVSEKTTGTTTKASEEVEREALEAMEKLWGVKMVDPIGIDEEIEKLENEVETFKHNIDFVLSESNSITTIEVPDWKRI